MSLLPQHLFGQLSLIVGPEAQGFVEGRAEQNGRYVPAFCRAADVVAGTDALVDRLGDRRWNMFVGAAPRSCKPGSGSNGCACDVDVVRSWCLWADCDSPAAVANLEQFEHRPTLIVASGGENHVHAYWGLSEPVPAKLIKRANRRLAYRLGADPAATNPSRILRLVGSWNVKRGRPVVCSHHDPGLVYRPGVLVNDLPDYPCGRPPTSQVATGSAASRLAGPLRRLRSATNGERNNILFWAARIARDEVAVEEQDAAREALRVAALEVGLKPSEVSGTLASGWRAAR